jgi:lysozyme family protein
LSLTNAVSFVLHILETGELTDRPDDPGGLTRWGIALNEHPELTRDDIINMTPERAGSLFTARYWPAGADGLPSQCATPLLAASVLQGPHAAVEALQHALGVSADGQLGALTQSAALKACLVDQKDFMARWVSEQVRQLRAGKAWDADGVGWVHRIALAALQDL